MSAPTTQTQSQSQTQTTITITKPNIGVFTNPEHDLWIAEAQPSLESVKKGNGLREGEVLVGIRSTGICG
ncbi:MAG: L-arabinitol 4-dehydrogenase, partial [Pleopsidium flavum]